MRILRYEVPVDDQWHELPISRQHVLSVNCTRPDVVELWALVTDGSSNNRSEYRVYGTGNPIDVREVAFTDSKRGYIGTAIIPTVSAFMPRFVWHLFGRER